MIIIFLFHLLTLVSSDFYDWLMFFFCNLENDLFATSTEFNVMFNAQYFCICWIIVYNFCQFFFVFHVSLCVLLFYFWGFIHYLIYDVVVFTDFYGLNGILVFEYFCDC